MQDEAEGLAKFIRNRIEANIVKPGKVLVLAPRRQFGYGIREALNRVGVPAHSFFYEESLDGNPTEDSDCAAQEAFTLLTPLARPDDRVALRCWCGFGNSSINCKAWARIRQHSASSGEPPRAVLEQLAGSTLTLPYTGPVVVRFRLLQARLAELNGLQGTELVDALFPVLAEWTGPIRTIAASFAIDGAAKTLLEMIQRGITQPELPTDVEYVRVMSLYKSKGLTADLVIVVGCIEGLAPFLPRNASPDEKQRALEEQRRLFFVAITRSTQTLVLSSVTQLSRADAWKMGAKVYGGDEENAFAIASRFMSELGPQRPVAVRGEQLL